MRELIVLLIFLLIVILYYVRFCLFCYLDNNKEYNPPLKIKVESIYVYKGCQYVVDANSGHAYKTKCEVVIGKTYLVLGQRKGYYILVE